MGCHRRFEMARRIEHVLGRLSGRAASAPAELIAWPPPAPTLVQDSRWHTADDEVLLAEMRQLSGTDAWVFEDEVPIAPVLRALRNNVIAIRIYQFYRPLWPV